MNPTEPSTSGTTTETFTIKCGLASVCRERKLLEKIEQDVCEMSDYIVEASLYINFIFNKMLYNNPHLVIGEKPQFLHYFYHLKAKSKQKYELDPDYNSLRSQAGLQKYEGNYLSNVIVFASRQYETVLMNNITVHMYRRVRKFFKFIAPETPNYETLDALFNKKSKNTVNPELVAQLKKYLQFQFENFFDLQTKWYKYIPFLYRLQRFFESNNMKNFRLFPIFKTGRKHVRYDTQALFQLLASVKLQGEFTSWKKFEPNRREIWSSFFHFEKFETAQHKFNYSITTDGVSLCLTMTRPCRNAAQPGKKRKCDDTAAKYASGEYQALVGIDPGLRLMFGMVHKTIHEAESTESKGTHMKVRSSKFRHDAGETRRKHKLTRWTRDLEDAVATDRNAQEVPISPMNIFYAEYTAFSLRYMKQLQQLYKQRKIARLKLEKYMCTERTLHQYARKILNPTDRTPEKKTLVFVGNPNISPAMKGYVRTPLRKLVATLRKHRMCDVVDVDEFRTTRLCAKCFTALNVSGSPERYAVCPHCKTTWHRDINAALNILQQGLSLLLHNRPVHPNLARQS